MIKVYQIILSDYEINTINNNGEQESPKIKAFFNRTFDSSFKADMFEHYTHVANIDVDGFEQAFRVMNLWEEDENFDRFQQLKRCASMSVGDIVEDHDGTRYRCSSFGFTPLENYK